jgi:hypothetical protein
MARAFDEFIGNLSDHLPLSLIVLFLLVAATAVGIGWYTWPWPRLRMPRWGRIRLRLPRLRWPRWRWPTWRRRHKRPVEEKTKAEPLAVPDDELPDVPVETLLSLADQLAAQGRYAEAVRERLRAIVRELVTAGVIEHIPGWTVTELAAAAGRARPGVRSGLDRASALFSDIWYGQRPAGAEQDAEMRWYAAEVHGGLRSGTLVGAPR